MSIINCDTHPSTTYQGHYGWHLNLQGVYYGPGCTKTVLPQLLDDLGIKRVMLLTSKSVLNKVFFFLDSFPHQLKYNGLDLDRFSKESGGYTSGTQCPWYNIPSDWTTLSDRRDQSCYQCLWKQWVWWYRVCWWRFMYRCCEDAPIFLPAR